MPLAFRDLQHFIAYLNSLAYRDMRDHYRGPSPAAAVAYGGFTQIYSKDAAVTEARHIKDRAMGGSDSGFWLYSLLGAAPSFSNNYNPREGTIARDADRMGSGARPTVAEAGAAISSNIGPRSTPARTPTSREISRCKSSTRASAWTHGYASVAASNGPTRARRSSSSSSREPSGMSSRMAS